MQKSNEIKQISKKAKRGTKSESLLCDTKPPEAPGRWALVYFEDADFYQLECFPWTQNLFSQHDIYYSIDIEANLVGTKTYGPPNCFWSVKVSLCLPMGSLQAHTYGSQLGGYPHLLPPAPLFGKMGIGIFNTLMKCADVFTGRLFCSPTVWQFSVSPTHFQTQHKGRNPWWRDFSECTSE